MNVTIKQCPMCKAPQDESTIEGAVHMASCQRYNGFTNYPTWCVNLGVMNDGSLYRFWRQDAKRIRQAAEDTEEASHVLARQVKGEFMAPDIMAPDMIKGFNGDILGWAYEQVNWVEIAMSILEDVEE